MLCLSLLIPAPCAYSGTLKDFEDELDKKPSQPERKKRRDSDEKKRDPFRHRTGTGCLDRRYGEPYDYENDEESLVSSLRWILMVTGVGALVVGGELTHKYFVGRKKGHPTLPYVRLENSYQRLLDNVDGYALRVEGGWSFIGAGFEFLRYWEEDSPDTLNSYSMEALYRFAPNKYVRASLGTGYRLFQGDASHGGFQIGPSLGVYPLSFLGVEGDLRWAFISERTVQDYRGGLTIMLPYFSARAGYRLIHVGNEDLHGPEFTLSLYW